MVDWQVHTSDLVSPIRSLEFYFQNGGASIIRAAFAHTYFVHPDRVRERTPYYPDRVRRSKEHYPGLDKSHITTWPGDGRKVRLDVNQRAQMAWEKYTGSHLQRSSGYGVRHIWGEPWNPDAFTAGWNLCYMPYWAGMLTEEQHQHPKLKKAIRQASWELYFRSNPVCEPPDFVEDPGLNIEAALEGQPLRVLMHTRSAGDARSSGQTTTLTEDVEYLDDEQIVERVKRIRKEARQSWSNISKAVRSLQRKPHDPFGTRKVEASAKSCVRRICDETRLTFAELESLLCQIRS